LAAVPKGAVKVALDSQGVALSSEALADRLRAWRDGGASDLAFLIGGAGGLDPAVREAADLVLSLGPMTWPHILVRALLAEQLYRAQTILAGHPYHRA
jgi:23S rRNA (pseudouridine1915-N3)-methyltransferase